MSYDVYVFPVAPGGDPAAALDALLGAEEVDAAAWTEPQAERAEALAASLQALNPGLERFVFDYGEIAKDLGITEADARAQWRHIELNTPDGDIPIQVTIYAEHACLTMPYWHTGDRARAAVHEAMGYLTIVERATGWTIFDPQIERVLDLTRDLDQVVDAYEVGSRHVEDLARQDARSARPKAPRRKRRLWPF